MTVAVDPRRGTTRWYREPIAWLVFGIPALAVASGIAMLVIAGASFDGVVVDDYYRKGLAVDRDLARDARAKKLGLAATLAVREVGTTDLIVTPGEWRVGDQVELALVHPTRAGHDQRLRLVRRGDQRFVGPGLRLEPGRWHVEVSADGWRLRGRLEIPGDGVLELEGAR